MTVISMEKDLDALLSKILSAARALTTAESGRIYILDPSGRRLICETTQNESVDEDLDELRAIDLYVDGRPNQRNVEAYCAFSGAPLRVDDVAASGAFDFAQRLRNDLQKGYYTQSVLVAPLNRPEEFTVGVLELCNARDPKSQERVAFKPDQEELVHAFASQAAVSINNARLLRENRRLITVLNETNRDLEQENLRLKRRVHGRCDFSDIIGNSKPMQRVFELVEKIADTDTTILIYGETGVGKELIAQALHDNSRRRNGRFVAQNCAALQEQLLESELFGYKKGAFTGAEADKPGLFDMAHNGTMFLDEIGDLPPSLQAKLLRVLQEGEFRPLGGLNNRKVNVRLLGATNRDLKELVANSQFREDLFYRLQVFPIEVPPLRDRREDLPALAQHFIDGFASVHDKKITGLTPRILDILMQHEFPGNIRELRNLIERAVLLAEPGGLITERELPSDLVSESSAGAQGLHRNEMANDGLKAAMAAYEARVILKRLDELGWNRTKTAEDLGISRRSLQIKMSKLGISDRKTVTQ
jgi:sigma-54-dependent transcriptional regulator